MSFGNLSAGTVALGLAAIAGVLFLLQRLRVRHAEEVVVTTMFWKEAVREARARVLVQRFRHPWAYALVLLLAGLLFLALAEPRSSAPEDVEHVLVLDGSAATAVGTRFDEAVENLREAARELPRDTTSVVFLGTERETLLLPGEHPRLLDERLRGLAPSATPPRFDEELVSLAEARTPNRELEITVFGDVAPTMPAPEGVRLLRGPEPETARAANTGITAVGAAPARSGVWSRVDVFVEVAGEGAESVAIEARLDEVPIDSAPERLGDHGRLYRDLPATGAVFTARLPGEDGVAFDDEASLVLPRRPPVRVRISDSLGSGLRAALAADPGLSLVAGDADVVVRRAGEGGSPNLPAFELAPAATQQEAFLITQPGGAPVDVAASAVRELGLAELDADALATVVGAPIELGARAGALRGVSVWSELVEGELGWEESRAFPIFLASSLRWLAARPSDPTWVTAGLPVVGETAPRIDGEGRTLDPIGAAFVPPSAGSYTANSAPTIVAALGSPGVTSYSSAPDLPERSSTAAATDWVTWLLLAVIALLLVEWHLWRTARIP